MADLQQDRGGGNELGSRPDHERTQHFDYVAVGYTDRSDLDDFIEGEGGNLVVRGPIHTGATVGEIATLGTGVTTGTPCLVVPLIHERIDEIQREVNAALDAFHDRWEPKDPGDGTERAEGAEPRTNGRDDGETRGTGQRRRTIADTGGTARGTSSGAIRKGSIGPRSG